MNRLLDYEEEKKKVSNGRLYVTINYLFYSFSFYTIVRLDEIILPNK